jgi:hypothetical protein
VQEKKKKKEKNTQDTQSLSLTMYVSVSLGLSRSHLSKSSFYWTFGIICPPLAVMILRLLLEIILI